MTNNWEIKFAKYLIPTYKPTHATSFFEAQRFSGQSFWDTNFIFWGPNNFFLTNLDSKLGPSVAAAKKRNRGGHRTQKAFTQREDTAHKKRKGGYHTKVWVLVP